MFGHFFYFLKENGIKKVELCHLARNFDVVGDTAPFVRAQTGLPLQAEKRGFFRGGPPKAAPMKWELEEERPWEGPKQERPPLTQSI